MKRLEGIIKGKCPHCGEGNVFKPSTNLFKLPVMKKECEVCHHVFEEEPGFFWGSMYVSYSLGIAIGLAVFFLSQFFFDDTFDLRIIWIVTGALLLFSSVNFKISRMVWMYMFTTKYPAAKNQL